MSRTPPPSRSARPALPAPSQQPAHAAHPAHPAHAAHLAPLDDDVCYRAVGSRDPRFDGRFFTGVLTTGIYCRPICPARTPARANVRFFRHAAEAERAGFRACRRCRPDASPGSPAWNAQATLVRRGLQLVAAGVVDDEGVAGLARRLHVSERHVTRLFVTELGVGPLAVARTRRLQLARQLLDATDLPVTEIAFASGFGSLRQFHDSFRAAFAASPSELRKARAVTPAARIAGVPRETASTGAIALRLAFRPPCAARAMLAFLAARAIPGTEEVSGRRYRRAIPTGVAGRPGAGATADPAGADPRLDGVGILEVEFPPDGAAEPAGAAHRPGEHSVLVRLPAVEPRRIRALAAAVRRLLDLDADPLAVDPALAGDPSLEPLVRRVPGIRLPGAFDGFETAARILLGQQVSVAAARTLAARLVGACAPSAVSGWRAFPNADAVAEADLGGLGVPAARAEALRALAAEVAAGRLPLVPGSDVDEVRARLLALPGVGRWTADLIVLRCLGDPDVLPVGDLALRRAAHRAGLPNSPAELAARSERWRPWRGYALMHLWHQLGAAVPPKDLP